MNDKVTAIDIEVGTCLHWSIRVWHSAVGCLGIVGAKERLRDVPRMSRVRQQMPLQWNRLGEAGTNLCRQGGSRRSRRRWRRGTVRGKIVLDAHTPAKIALVEHLDNEAIAARLPVYTRWGIF